MKRKNISLDIPIRWNSTYKLLQNITKYKKVVQLYEMQISNNNSDVDVDADLLRDLFEIFDASTNIFCTVYYPTSHQVIMQITSIYMVLQNYLSYEIFNDTIFAMIEKIKKYWGHILNLIVKDGLKQVDGTLEKIRDIALHIILIVSKQNMNYFFIAAKLQI